MSLADLILTNWDCKRLAIQLDFDSDLVIKLQQELRTTNASEIAYEILKRWVTKTGGDCSNLHRALNCKPLVHLIREFRQELLVGGKPLVNVIVLFWSFL